MNELSQNSRESDYPYRICPQKPPVKILHDIVMAAPNTPVYHGRITFNQHRLQNIIAFKVNFLSAPPNVGGGEVIAPTSGQVFVLLSNTLASLQRTNQFWISTSDGSTTLTTATPVSNIIAYTAGPDADTEPLSTFDNNNIQFLAKPYTIQDFDWQVLNLVTQGEPINVNFNEIAFEISFYYACDCRKKY